MRSTSPFIVRMLPLAIILMGVSVLSGSASRRHSSQSRQTPTIDSTTCIVHYIDTQTFQTTIARLDTTAWRYLDTTPCVIDCYTTWCGPCKRLSPIMEELARDYCGRVKFYKVDIERDRVLGRVFEASSIPTVVYIPVEGNPTITRGLMAKENFEQIINSYLLKNTTDDDLSH